MRRVLRTAVPVVVAIAFAGPGNFLPTAAVQTASSSGYLRPVKGPIVRHFEPPPTPYAAGHRGIDMAVPIGTTVLASNDGVVVFAGPVATELFVSIDHPDGIRTTYSFLSAITVKKGAAVARGQPIALSGPGDGSSPEPHLHFGARVGEAYIDPEPLLLDGLRRDLSQAIRLVPLPDGWSAATTPARASILGREPGSVLGRARRP